MMRYSTASGSDVPSKLCPMYDDGLRTHCAAGTLANLLLQLILCG